MNIANGLDGTRRIVLPTSFSERQWRVGAYRSAAIETGDDHDSETKKSRPTRGRKRGIVLAALSSVAVATVAVAAVMLSEPAISPEQADVTVYKRANCGCCNKWVDHLRDQGLVVSVQNVRSTRDIQTALGVPDEMRACHTATVGDRWVEGHVPADLIYALIQDDPADVRGLAVPAMPIGSPGMEGPNPQAYEIMRISPTGEVDVMAEREGATSPSDQYSQ